MCGIAGIFNLDAAPVDESVLRGMRDALVHRGPDGEGLWIDGGAGLAHRRLSIIDLDSGAQPMGNEDGTIQVTFNGEIYNHVELREWLEAKGHVFKTSCDTEVILHLYEEMGSECVTRLEGMFAFAVFDASQRELLLARDRLGQKPLVCFLSGSGPSAVFAFASELQALAKHPLMPKTLDPQALHDYLSLQYVPAPATIYESVRKLPPGHILRISRDDPTPKVSRYWRCDGFGEDLRISYEDACGRLRELMENAVKKRLMSDVPLGSFLSGGIDSTIIVGLMRKFSLLPVKTFTIGFLEDAYDERSYAKLAADHLCVEHTAKVANPADFAVLEKLVSHYGEPYCDASMIPTYFLSEFTREHVTVALSGDGADELFGGYYRYLVMKFARFANVLPLAARRHLADLLARFAPSFPEERSNTGKFSRLLDAFAARPETRLLDLTNRFPERMKNSFYTEEFAKFAAADTGRLFERLHSECRSHDSAERSMETDLTTYLPGDILTKVDIASMAVSLEVRSPFMDHKVVEFAASLPIRYKIKGTTKKRILRDTFKDFIPEAIRGREKMGFGVPIAAWLRGDWGGIAKERLLDGAVAASGYFKRDIMERMLKEHSENVADHSYRLWALLVLDIWLGARM
ncbi:MAG: asparagine synthase (glutamine-hydrolyzing) [Victivallales bacterium]|nr:asparagine synthase (glutamine-hydrolyzing) [Victivallales bacterium]